MTLNRVMTIDYEVAGRDAVVAKNSKSLHTSSSFWQC